MNEQWAELTLVIDCWSIGKVAMNKQTRVEYF